jgi:hypothetical protein
MRPKGSPERIGSTTEPAGDEPMTDPTQRTAATDVRGTAVPRPVRAAVRPGPRVRPRDAPHPPVDAQGDRPRRVERRAGRAAACSPAASGSASADRRPAPGRAQRRARRRRLRGRGRLHRHPRGDRRSVPRRRLERPRRPRPRAGSSGRHPLEHRDVDDDRRGRPADDPVRPARRGEGLRAPGERRGLRLALRSATATTRCTRGRSRTRTTCAGPGGRRRRGS